MIIKVKVRPGAKEDKLEKISDNNYLCYIRELPVKGKANAVLVKIMAKEFDVSSRDVLIKNPFSRKKIIEIKSK